jgi:hypothetical protein
MGSKQHDALRVELSDDLADILLDMTRCNHEHTSWRGDSR